VEFCWNGAPFHARGARAARHVFAQPVLKNTHTLPIVEVYRLNLDTVVHCSGVSKGDKVSCYVDIDGQCRKGLVKRFEGSKMFIGNGIAAVSRQDVFSDGGRIWYVPLYLYFHIS
jgi:hypothetical protein